LSLNLFLQEMAAYARECHADWLCVQHGAQLANSLKKRFSVRGIPTVIAVSKDGQLISKSGRSELTERGRDAFRDWLTAAKSVNV